jgi:hypothetical protein
MQRLAGALIDVAFNTAASLPVYFAQPFWELRARNLNPFSLYTRTGAWGLIAGATVLGFWLVQWTLIVVRGQTLGKMLVGTRIVRSGAARRGARAGFIHGVVLRDWWRWEPSLPPSFSVLSLVTFLRALDAVFILGRHRRCLHDWAGGTEVVQVRAARST